jgi:hypothetical protein
MGDQNSLSQSPSNSIYTWAINTRSIDNPITRSIGTPACSSTEQAGSFLLVVAGVWQTTPFSSSIASGFDPDIGSADFCPRCPVSARFASGFSSYMVYASTIHGRSKFVLSITQ